MPGHGGDPGERRAGGSPGPARRRLTRALPCRITVLAGDTLPIEVYCHIPIMCEDRSLPYAYVPSKSDLGAAAGSKRPTCVIMIKPHGEYQEKGAQGKGSCSQRIGHMQDPHPGAEGPLLWRCP
nr:PREDICTED: H/ACA ribonucleoprotein complex subunit 2 [Struthio camelus australis]